MKHMKILTEEEFQNLFNKNLEDWDDTRPDFVDGNESEWIEWFYKHGYRLVKLEE